MNKHKNDIERREALRKELNQLDQNINSYESSHEYKDNRIRELEQEVLRLKSELSQLKNEFSSEIEKKRYGRCGRVKPCHCSKCLDYDDLL